MKSDYSQMKRLHQLLRGLEWSSDKQLFFDRRVDPEGDCTGDILEEYQWVGKTIISVANIVGTQRCMDICDKTKDCMAWSYKPSTERCWGLNQIEGVMEGPGVRSGSCIGSSMKVKCEEKLVGQYPCAYLEQIENINKIEDCMARCDNLNICYGWTFSDFFEMCILCSNIGEFIPQTYNFAGSCVASQARLDLPDPLKPFREESLARHNLKREKHCVPQLTLDKVLNKKAQDFADQLAAADVIPPKYDITKMQTVYYGVKSVSLHGSVIVDDFYDEHRIYDYNKPDFTHVKHFPKIIWKSTTKMGVGRAYTNKTESAFTETMFVVTMYDWTGDMSESYRDNIQKPCK
ncbi:hypothetical protein I4U23_012092 [Adineta vaga]|nr:hypothetical protein I4U23_012092 [Adineta vaga]